jgi:thioredoxin 1
MKKTKEFTAQNWEKEVLQSNKPVLVDFWAPWCGPCRMQGPLVEDLAEAVGSNALVGKLNSDEHPEIAARYGIRGIPTLIVFKNGKPARTFVGVTTVPNMKAALLDGAVKS